MSPSRTASNWLHTADSIGFQCCPIFTPSLRTATISRPPATDARSSCQPGISRHCQRCLWPAACWPLLPAALSALPLVTLSDGLPTLESGLTSGDPLAGAARGNPYLWLDPRNAAVYVERIRDALGGVDPSGAATYRANAAGYLDRLRSLDA